MKIKVILYLLIALIFICISNSCIIIDLFLVTPEESAADSGKQDETVEGEEADTNNTETPGDVEYDKTDTLSDQIIVTGPIPDQLITSPLIITGEARGTWFFEATFPVGLLDSNRNVLALHYAATEEEWMTEDFISFTATIEFEDPETATGFLVLDKNNPSDIREYDAQLVIPVRFE